MRLYIIVVFIHLACAARGDTVILTNGRVITGDILRRDNNGVLIDRGYGTFTYPNTSVKEVRQDPAASELREVSHQRILPSGRIIAQLAREEWATEIKQIPATVIAVGNLKHVPYTSFQCGYAYELNIYGDPDAPAGIEMGVRRHLLNSDDAKRNCANLVAGALRTMEDKGAIRRLGLKEGTLVQDGFTFEITPPSAEDAYGGWWVSVYSLHGLDQARASGNELLAITEPLKAPSAQAASSSEGTAGASTWSKNEAKLARPVAPTSRSSSVDSVVPTHPPSSDSAKI